ncbi:MAG: hypothetical protein J0H55_08410 [Chitinophagaceae bacterium]|nr:hypothetical protein [Chitinophagaceae bacterium]
MPEAAVDMGAWQKVFEQILRETWEGKIKPGELSDAHIAQTYEELNKGMQQGWGGTAENELPDQSVLRMQQNLYKFSAAKDASMQLEINQQLYDKNGNLLPFDEFKTKLDSLGIKYNKTWLQTEYRTAKQSGQTAQFWQDIQANKALYPNLKYKTQEDDRVRDEHQTLNNIVKPVDDEFWNNYYPPNGWNCRCFTVQTAEDATTDENMPKITDKDVRPEFRMNVGKTGQVFNEDSKSGHRFFALAKESPDWRKRFELSKLEGGFNTVKTPKGNKVRVSIYADEKDLNKNLKNAIIIADQLDFAVKIRPHLDGEIIRNVPNPEYLINGKIADRKSPEGMKQYNLLRKSQKQGCEIVVFDMGNWPREESLYIKKLKNSLKDEGHYPVIKEIIIISKDGKAKHWTREDFVK